MPDDDQLRSRLRSFALGSVLGASAAVLAAARRRRAGDRPARPAGLAAFEDAPCYRETVERERSRSAAR